jgi:hypothetical protein
VRVLGPLAIGGFLRLTFAQSAPEPVSYLLTYGPLGVFAVLMVLGRVVSRTELDRANARADRAEAQRDELAQRMVSDLVPLVAEVQRTMVPALKDTADGQRLVMTALTELRHAIERFDTRRMG